MDLRQLRCFVAVADERGFRPAGLKLNIVQPTVTLLVQRLEEETGSTLFNRSRRPVELTPIGRRFLAEARVVLAAADRALAVGRQQAPPPLAVLRVGTMTGMGDRLEIVLASLARRRPRMRVELEGVPLPQRLDKVRDGELDAAFVRFCGDAPTLVLLPAWREPLRVALPADAAPATRAAVRFEDLAGLPLRLVPQERNPGLHDLVLRACRAGGVEPRLGAPSTSLRGTLGELAGGGAWTVVHDLPSGAGLPPGVVTRPLEPELTVPVYLAVRARDEYAWLLLEGCRDVVAQTAATDGGPDVRSG